MEERLGDMRKGRRERIEKGSHCFFKSSGYDKLELMFPQGNAFLLSSRLDSAVKRCSSQVLKLSFQRSCLIKGLSRRD